jgi:ribonuclease BN (tRNA processing enzyme)
MVANRSGTERRYGRGVQVTFYGVRGSCPCAGERYRRVGGNTSCSLLTIEGDLPLILDLGTGVRALGDVIGPKLAAEGTPLRANALLSHLHFDHILGLPFFGPLHDPGAVLDVYGPCQDGTSLQDTLPSAVQPPFFPVHMTDFRGEVRFHDTEDSDFALGTAKIRARAVPHRGHTLGFRIEADGATVAYIPDHQAPLDRRTVPDGVLELCEGADLLIHDSQYTDEEFVEKSEWGHSTVAYAVRVAAEAGVRRLLLFHHDPAHTDRDLDHLLGRARRLQDAKRLSDVSIAAEGMTVDLGPT